MSEESEFNKYELFHQKIGYKKALKEQAEKIALLKKKIIENRLKQTTYSDCCWDDGDIWYKKSYQEDGGDWTEEQWEDMINNFDKEGCIFHLDFNELMQILDECFQIQEQEAKK